MFYVAKCELRHFYNCYQNDRIMNGFPQKRKTLAIKRNETMNVVYEKMF